jgi:hypothetical protein
MKIENQVCSLEQAKRLKELGISQDSYFLFGADGQLTEGWSVEGTETEFFAAYTTAELGMLLPERITTHTEDGVYHCSAQKELYPFPEIEENHQYFVVTSDTSEAEARAGMLLFLLKYEFVTVEKVNKWLNH